jgi:hypothetical protein
MLAVMADLETREPGGAVLDVAIALGVGAGRVVWRAGRVATGPLRPALRPRNWPRRVRLLAETGHQQRADAAEAAVRLFCRVTPPAVLMVLDELDVTSIVREVLDEIDLPEIIRVSTGSVAGDTVRDARIAVMSADDVVSRWSHRMHRGGRARAAPGDRG